ncbi:hypothetical protein [Sphingomonas immobilis]|uniref:DUF11 domain-containing protein n=1 Tax=Sphingomonas immobilis TaxID=3063997 RepID=A0ABT8ZUR1_9SPHN|nr:hypothetical protein [Sphingomonas sp. CA1-15]MDO7841315.1 hypothetical protein [Sphingomonas sp. CA1-15]
MIGNRVRLLLLSGTAAMATFSGAAHAQTAAQSTVAGTQINNQASVTYTVNGGSTQSATSNTASFVVDRKVNFTVINDQANASTKVNLGQTGAITSFKVTNTTNGIQDFLLSPTQGTILPQLLGLVTGTDDFDLSNLKVYVDKNGNGVYDPGTDVATYIDELAPDQSVEVFIVGDVPTTAGISLANVALQVTVAAGGATGTQGAALVDTSLSLGNADMTTDVIFVDNDNDALGPDIARNGQGWAYASYEIGARNVAMSVTKTALVVSDGYNPLTPKALPGAIVQYCLLANNGTLTAAANGVVLTDTIPANTTYIAGSVLVGLPGGTCTLAGAPQDDATVYNSTTNKLTVPVGTLTGGASTAVSFRVTIK